MVLCAHYLTYFLFVIFSILVRLIVLIYKKEYLSIFNITHFISFQLWFLLLFIRTLQKLLIINLLGSIFIHFSLNSYGTDTLFELLKSRFSFFFGFCNLHSWNFSISFLFLSNVLDVLSDIKFLYINSLFNQLLVTFTQNFQSFQFLLLFFN